MKAWLLNELGGIDKMHLVDVPDPQPGDDEVVLDIRFAALNPADRYLAERQYPANPPLPHILGRDGCGIISQLGANVTGLKLGDARAILRSDVGVTRWGTFAQRLAVPADSLVDIPAGWSLQEASCATLVYLTAHQALTMWGELRPANVLVTGASGGVGVATVQLARAMGHTVIALSRSEQKRSRLLQLGAAVAMDPADPHWRKSLKDRLAPGRVDLAIDNIGGSLFPQVIDTLGENGKLSVVGRLAGPVPNFNTSSLLFRRLRIGGVAAGAYTRAEAHAAWDHVLTLLAKTGARPLIDSVFPLDDLPKAFERLRSGPMGKVLVNP